MTLFIFIKSINTEDMIEDVDDYLLPGHLLAQPATHAPNTRAEKPGHTSIHAANSSPGH